MAHVEKGRGPRTHSRARARVNFPNYPGPWGIGYPGPWGIGVLPMFCSIAGTIDVPFNRVLPMFRSIATIQFDSLLSGYLNSDSGFVIPCKTRLWLSTTTIATIQ